MTPEVLVESLKTTAIDAAAGGVLKNLATPPGRRPPETLVRASAWYEGLSGEDRSFVHFVARSAAHAALFNVLAALDGVSALDDPPHGALRLTYVAADGSESLLNPEGAELHDILNGLVHPAHEPLAAQPRQR